MMSFRILRNSLFGAAIAGALGFGATQVMATTAMSAQPTCANVPCEQEEACDRCCQGLFPGPLTSGFCGDEGECRCAV